MTDIKQLAQAEAEKRYPIDENTMDVFTFRTIQLGFVEGAEFGYNAAMVSSEDKKMYETAEALTKKYLLENQRWIPVSEAMPKEEDRHNYQILAWDKYFEAAELVHYFHFIERVKEYSHWQTITPPKS